MDNLLAIVTCPANYTCEFNPVQQGPQDDLTLIVLIVCFALVAIVAFWVINK